MTVEENVILWFSYTVLYHESEMISAFQLKLTCLLVFKLAILYISQNALSGWIYSCILSKRKEKWQLIGFPVQRYFSTINLNAY